MTSRERVTRCLEFDNPDRPPRDLWVLPIAEIQHGADAINAFREKWPTDFRQTPSFRANPPKLAYGEAMKVGESRDEWGCVFVNRKEGIHGEVKEPILADWSKLEDLHVPEELLDFDADKVNDFCRNEDHFVFACGWARPFERIQFLRGTENVYMDLAMESPELKELLGIVHDFFVRQYELWARTDCDALAVMDDWGGQRSLLISPDMWRATFRPLYEDYARIAHDNGKKLFIHSDGYIQDIYPELIEIGFDAVNSQLFCMDLRELGRTCKGKVAFWGEIDRQQALPHGSVEDVRNAVKQVYENLYDPSGGVIQQFSFEEGVPMENAEAVFETWRDLTG